jgi:hypothetical protein
MNDRAGAQVKLGQRRLGENVLSRTTQPMRALSFWKMLWRLRQLPPAQCAKANLEFVSNHFLWLQVLHICVSWFQA